MFTVRASFFSDASLTDLERELQTQLIEGGRIMAIEASKSGERTPKIRLGMVGGGTGRANLVKLVIAGLAAQLHRPQGALRQITLKQSLEEIIQCLVRRIGTVRGLGPGGQRRQAEAGGQCPASLEKGASIQHVKTLSELLFQPG